MWFYGMLDDNAITSDVKKERFHIHNISENTIKTLIAHRYRVIHLFKNYYLVRDHSLLNKSRRISTYGLARVIYD